MKKSTLCYCLRDDEVLLGMKKRGFGLGKWNGYGGKVDENETPKAAAVRELEEESTLFALEKNLTQVALIRFYFDGTPVFECYVFLIRSWEREPQETEEMKPCWFPVINLPFQEMWAADSLWLPLVLQGNKIEAEVNFNHDGSVVKEFSYKLVEFD